MLEHFLPHSPGEGPPVPKLLPAWPWIKKPNLGEKKSGNQPPVGNPVDEIEEMTQRKREEFRAKGYPPGQIERALLWAKEWSFGSTKATFDVSPEVGRQVFRGVYKQALTLSDKWIESLHQS